MKNLIFISLFLLSFSSSAQTDPQKIIDEFFTQYREKSTDSALDYIFSTNKWMNESKDEIQSIKSQIKETVKLLGDYYGYDLIVSKNISGKFEVHSYFIRYERQPLRFTFQFYSPNGQWRLQNFSYDDTFDEELKESAKVYRLK